MLPLLSSWRAFKRLSLCDRWVSTSCTILVNTLLVSSILFFITESISSSWGLSSSEKVEIDLRKRDNKEVGGVPFGISVANRIEGGKKSREIRIRRMGNYIILNKPPITFAFHWRHHFWYPCIIVNSPQEKVKILIELHHKYEKRESKNVLNDN